VGEVGVKKNSKIQKFKRFIPIAIGIKDSKFKDSIGSKKFNLESI